MQLLSNKINERFYRTATAFRFFDIRSTSKISINDFSFVIDQLQIKFSRQQVQDIFKYLDKDQDNHLVYNDFCELCEEKRRHIDPFESIVQKVREKQKSESRGENLLYSELGANPRYAYTNSELADYKGRKLDNKNLNNNGYNHVRT